MHRVHCHIAETRRQIDEALRLRYQVFAEECDYLVPVCRRIPRELDPFDTLDTTIHFVVFVDDIPVGAARLMLPNPEVAQWSNSRFGFDIESKYDLTALAESDIRLAEAMRYCVLRRFRRSNVAAKLHAEIVQTSHRLGITHWIGCANTETDSAEDVQLIQAIGASRGLVHSTLHITPHTLAPADVECNRPFFRSTERNVVRADLADARFPSLLTMYSQRLGARIIGPALYDVRFRMYSVPVLMPMSDQQIDHSAIGGPFATEPLAA